MLHAGLPGKGSEHRLLSDIAKIDRSAAGLDTFCGGITPEEGGTPRAAVSDILWGDPDLDSNPTGSIVGTYNNLQQTTRLIAGDIRVVIYMRSD